MIIHRSLEDRLAHNISANGTSVFHDHGIVDIPGRGLFTSIVNALEVGAGVLMDLLQSDSRDRVDTLDSHLRQDIGLAPKSASVGRGPYDYQGPGYL
jgi:hypothetical protein